MIKKLIVITALMLIISFPCFSANPYLKWVNPENSNGIIISYNGTEQNVGNASSFYILDLKGIEYGTEYSFKIKAYNNAGESIYTKTIVYNTPEKLEIPSKPEKVWVEE